MPSGGQIGTEYARAVLASRRAGYRLTAEGRERVLEAFRAALLRIVTLDPSDTPLHPERAFRLRRQIEEILRRFEMEWAAATKAAMTGTLAETMELHLRAIRAVEGLTGRTINADFNRVPPLVSNVLAHTRKADTFRSLLQYRMRDVNRQVDALLKGAITRGASSGETTVDLARMLASGDAEVGLSKIRARIKDATLAQKMNVSVGSTDWARYGLSQSETRAVRSVLNDARRIAVSETANTMREANAAALTLNPTVAGGKWQTSSRHGSLTSSPDLCDVLAEADHYDMGPGIYPPDRWPLSHPYCMCYQAGPIVWRDPNTWNEPKERVPLRPDPALERKIRDLARRGERSEKWAERLLEETRASLTAVDRNSILRGL